MINAVTILKSSVLPVICLLLIENCGTKTTAGETQATGLNEPVDSILFNPNDSEFFPKTEVVETFGKAVEAYVEAAYPDGENVPDTFFIVRNVEFPEIDLPRVIKNFSTKSVTQDVSAENMRSGRDMVHLNVIGWRHKKKSEFIVISFFPGGKPRHNCHIRFTHYPERKEIKLDTLYFEHAYSKK
jgi:hypothetical protein